MNSKIINLLLLGNLILINIFGVENNDLILNQQSDNLIIDNNQLKSQEISMDTSKIENTELQITKFNKVLNKIFLLPKDFLWTKKLKVLIIAWFSLGVFFVLFYLINKNIVSRNKTITLILGLLMRINETILIILIDNYISSKFHLIKEKRWYFGILWILYDLIIFIGFYILCSVIPSILLTKNREHQPECIHGEEIIKKTQ